MCLEHEDYSYISQQLSFRAVAVFIIVSCMCFLFTCMYLWPYYWINKVCHIFSLFVSNRSSHNQMTEYFEEHSEDKQFWCKDNYIAGHFFKVYLTENSVEHRFSWFCSFRRLCECLVFVIDLLCCIWCAYIVA